MPGIDNPDNDERGAWTSRSFLARNYSSEGTYPVSYLSLCRMVEGPHRAKATGGFQGEVSGHEPGRSNLVGQGRRMGYPRSSDFSLRSSKAACRRRSGRIREVGHTQDAKKNFWNT